MHNLGKFLRALTDLALEPRFPIAAGNNSLQGVRGGPRYHFGPPEEREFCNGFYDGANYAQSTTHPGSAAYENGLRLGFRLRDLRKEHGLETRYGCDRESLTAFGLS